MEFNHYFFVFLRRNSDFVPFSEDEMKKFSFGHFDFQHKQYEENNLVLSGPLDGAGGIYLFKEEGFTKEKLKTLLNSDPFVEIGLFTPEIHKWAIPVFFSLNYSNKNDLNQFFNNIKSMNL